MEGWGIKVGFCPDNPKTLLSSLSLCPHTRINILGFDIFIDSRDKRANLPEVTQAVFLSRAL